MRQPNCARRLSAITTVAGAGLLAGCGGGGAEIGLLIPFGSLSASATSCTVQQGQSTCEVLLLAVSADAVSISLRDSQGNSFSVAINQSNSVRVQVPVGGATFSFSYGGSRDSVITVQAGCAGGLVFTGRVCEFPRGP
jgi:hypothetical protein